MNNSSKRDYQCLVHNATLQTDVCCYTSSTHIKASVSSCSVFAITELNTCPYGCVHMRGTWCQNSPWLNFIFTNPPHTSMELARAIYLTISPGAGGIIGFEPCLLQVLVSELEILKRNSLLYASKVCRIILGIVATTYKRSDKIKHLLLEVFDVVCWIAERYVLSQSWPCPQKLETIIKTCLQKCRLYI